MLVGLLVAWITMDQGYPGILTGFGQVTRARQWVEQGDGRAIEELGRLTRRADRALRVEPVSVLDKPMAPPSGDRHDYASLAPYWWPDPDRPGGLPFIRRDGQVNPDRDRYDRPRVEVLSDEVPPLAQAFALTGQTRYAEGAARFLRVWFLDPATRMNPHLEFGQFIPGRNQGRGAGIIETHGMILLIDAARLIEPSQVWTDADAEGLSSWLIEYLQWLRTSELGLQEAQATNNHGTWYDAQVSAYALFTGQDELARQILMTVGERRIAKQILPDGRQPEELARTKALDYSLFNLEAFVTLARLGERVGVDLWAYRSEEGASITQAIDYLIPYAVDGQPWPHRQISEPKIKKLVPMLIEASRHTGEDRYARALERLNRQGIHPEPDDVLFSREAFDRRASP